MSTPVRLGDTLREVRDDEEPEPPASGVSICDNCIHQGVCAVASAAEVIGAQVSSCPQHFAVLDHPEGMG
jgi:hypothetical protein